MNNTRCIAICVPSLILTTSTLAFSADLGMGDDDGQSSSLSAAESPPCEPANAVVNLSSGQWHQISLPCAPPTNAQTVQAVFGDDLNGNYGSDWQVFSYDAAGNAYVDIGVNGELSQGAGYWIIHHNGSAAELDMPAGSMQTPLALPNQCTSTSGCYRLPLTTQSGTAQWNMSGYPFADKFSMHRLRAVTRPGTACDSGCTLDQAEINNVVGGSLWHFNGFAYDELQINDALHPWSGFWAAALAGGQGLAPELEFEGVASTDIFAELPAHTWTPVALNTLADVNPCPARDDCGYSATEGQSGVLNDWNGGVFASEEGVLGGLVVWGGGHAGYYGNEIYFFDLATLLWSTKSQPTTGQIPGDPDSFGLDPETCRFHDGKPLPMHTYDLVTYLPTTRQFLLPNIQDVPSYKPPGAENGCYSPHGMVFDFRTSRWLALASPVPNQLWHVSSAFDAKRNASWVWEHTYGYGGLVKFDIASGQWTQYQSSRSLNLDSTGAIDPVRDLFVARDFDGVLVKDLSDPDAERVIVTTSGDTQIQTQSQIGFEWVPSLGKFVAWKSGNDLYYLTPPDGNWRTQAWVWTKTRLAGVAPPDPVNGPYSKFQVAPELGIAFVVTSVDSPVYAVRLVDTNQ
jgi:hypothetical protein